MNRFMESGVYLKHLQIEETIADVSVEQLDEIPNWIKRFDFVKIEGMLVAIHDNAKQMIELIEERI